MSRQLITVCVDYHDVLAITLPRNLAHVERALVVTSPDDLRTQEVAVSAGAEVYCTDAFYRRGAHFNKGAAIEEGFDALGREGWILHLDSDCLLPARADFGRLDSGFLYGARRRMLPTVADYHDSLDWRRLREIPAERQHKYMGGYFQLFHAGDPALRRRPWYPTNWKHAGGSDSEFSWKWPRSRWRWMPFEVLHIGPDAINWCGRAVPFADGTLPAAADDRRRALTAFLDGRVKMGSFAGEKL